VISQEQGRHSERKVNQEGEQSQSIQYSLEQFKKQQAQIEDMKKRILINTWTTQQNGKEESNQEGKGEEKQYQRSHYDSEKKKTPTALQVKLNANFNKIQDKENKQQPPASPLSLSDQKYHEYLKSIQSHQKRSGSSNPASHASAQSPLDKKKSSVQTLDSDQPSQNSHRAGTINQSSSQADNSSSQIIKSSGTQKRAHSA
jgi:hypothetical protein